MRILPFYYYLKEENMRNLGIDLYRIVLTFMICLLHTLGQGGLLASNAPGTLYFRIFWFLETAAYCAVDGYALISGYTAREKEFDLKRISFLWLQVFFYSFIMSFIVSAFGLKGDMSTKAIILSAFPASSEAYWYFSAYIPLIILEPFIVKGLKNIDDEGLKTLFILIVVIFTFSGLVGDAYKTQVGYSFIWLTLLFILGYIIKRLNMFEKWSNRKLLIGSFITVLLSWGPMAISGNDKLISYISPTIVFDGIFLMMLFARFKPNEKFVKALAPLTFGIYLFQNNRIMWSTLKDLFLFVNNMSVYAIVPVVILLATLIFVAGTVVDFLRQQLFKVLKVDKLAIGLNNLAMKGIGLIKKIIY